jgi:hypothetical protein
MESYFNPHSAPPTGTLRILVIRSLETADRCHERAVPLYKTHIPHPNCHMGYGLATARELWLWQPESLSTNA